VVEYCIMNLFDDIRYHGGTSSDDYYYKLDKGGKKRYFSRRTDKQTSKTCIPPLIVNDIKERHPIMRAIEDTSALISQKKTLEDQITNFQHQIVAIQNKLRQIDEELKNAPNQSMINEHKITEDKLKQESLKRQYEQKIQFDKSIQELLKKQHEEKIQSTTHDTDSNEHIFLKTLGIKDKHDYKKWLLDNHPDKGGKTEICQLVMDAFQKINV